MEKLPSEILQDIFTFLTLGERITCLRVCRTWSSILDTYCLFYNVDIDKNDDQFKKLMEVMEQSTQYAAQVEELKLDSCLPFNFNKRKICTLFPNLRIVKLKYPRTSNNPIKYFKEPLKVTHSTPKIRVLTDGGVCELASQMLHSNLCGRLEVLDLDFAFSNYDTRSFLTQLKHAPILRKLRISNLTMGLNDLEELHDNLPALQDYWIQCNTLLPSTIPVNIKPLPPVEHFQLNVGEVENIETHIMMYKYMTKKYANANGVRCLDHWIDQYEHSDVERIFDSAIYDYLRVIAPKSPIFVAFYVPERINIFKAFDDAGCQLTSLHTDECRGNTFIPYLVASKQAKYIEELDLIDTPVSVPNYLRLLPALTEFSMYIHEGSGVPETINITDFLNVMPNSVTSFTLKCPIVICDPFNTSWSYIQRLEIDCENSIPKGLGDMITSCFPRLLELELSGMVTENINIAIQNYFLRRVTFRDMGGKHGFTFKSANQTEPQHYLCQDNDITNADYEHISTLPNISFSSFSERELEISDCIEIF